MASMSSNLRRRPSLVPAPRTRAPDWRDWADIPKDMAKRIAGHALDNDVSDYLQFRAACATWREHTDDPKQLSVLDQRFHPSRWILLPNGTSTYEAADDSRSRHHMVNLSRQTKITVDLPHLLGHTLAIGCGGSPGGVLVLVHAESLVVRLLNPLTGQHIDLPSVAPLLSKKRMGRLDRDKDFLRRCKVTGAGFAGDSTVMLHFAWDNILVSAKLGGDYWGIIRQCNLFCSVFPFCGKVYIAEPEGLMVVDDADATPPTLVLAATWPSADIESKVVYMADSSGVLLVLTNKVNYLGGQGQSDDYTVEFDLFRLDADAGVLIPVKDLGQGAMFVGDSSGALVVSCKDTIVPNAIYFQHDLHERLLVRGVSNGTTRAMTEAEGGFLDDLVSYVRWNGKKKEG